VLHAALPLCNAKKNGCLLTHAPGNLHGFTFAQAINVGTPECKFKKPNYFSTHNIYFKQLFLSVALHYFQVTSFKVINRKRARSLFTESEPQQIIDN
jgi:uncharacterized protein with FMN-binding domain